MRQDGSRDFPFIAHAPSVLMAWVAEARPGEWASYYTGDLANARAEKKPRAITMGAAAWQLYETGRFLLFQARLKGSPPGVFDYRLACIKTAYQRRLKDGKGANGERDRRRGSADTRPSAE